MDRRRGVPHANLARRSGPQRNINAVNWLCYPTVAPRQCVFLARRSARNVPRGTLEGLDGVTPQVRNLAEKHF